jgi:hypothetical protein
MRFLLLLVSLFFSASVIAQDAVDSPQKAASSYYVGISSGFQGPYLKAFQSFSGYDINDRDYSKGMVTELYFGKKLLKSLYAELGLSYSCRSMNFSIPDVHIIYHLRSYTFASPLGLRYRSNGTRFRISAAVHYLLGDIFEARSGSKTDENGVQTLMSRKKISDALVYTGQFRGSFGLEYEVQPGWQLRLEAQALSAPNHFLRSGIWYSPSLNFGLYKHF